MRFLILIMALLIVGIFFKWLWEQSKTYDRKSFRLVLVIAFSCLIFISIVSSLNIEQYRISSSIQGVITRLNSYSIRGQITHYSIDIKGLANQGSFVAQQDSVTIKNEPINRELIAILQNAHKTRQVVFINFHQVTSYLFGESRLELKDVNVEVPGT